MPGDRIGIPGTILLAIPSISYHREYDVFIPPLPEPRRPRITAVTVPNKARVTTKYTLNPPPTSTYYRPKNRGKKRKRDDQEKNQPPSAGEQSEQSQPDDQQPKKDAVHATLTLKSYESTSGICLKYSTDKGQEVNRIIAGLGKLGKVTAGLSGVITEEASAEDGKAEGQESKTPKIGDIGETPVASATGGVNSGGGSGGGGSGASSGGKKKKKGKR